MMGMQTRIAESFLSVGVGFMDCSSGNWASRWIPDIQSDTGLFVSETSHLAKQGK